MTASLWLAALGLMLILEGLLPLIAPEKWRAVFQRAIHLANGQVRFVGLLSVILGLILLGVTR